MTRPKRKPDEKHQNPITTKQDPGPVYVTIVMDEDKFECIYVNGKRYTDGAGDSSLYVSEVVQAADDRLCVLEHLSIEYSHEQWPDTLKEALRQPGYLL